MILLEERAPTDQGVQRGEKSWAARRLAAGKFTMLDFF